MAILLSPRRLACDVLQDALREVFGLSGLDVHER